VYDAPIFVRYFLKSRSIFLVSFLQLFVS